VRTRGVELESVYRGLPGLEISIAGGWNDAAYTSFMDAPCPTETVNPTSCDFTGRRVAGSPPWTAAVAAGYEFSMGSIGHSVFIDAEYSHTASYKLDLSNYTRVDAYGLTNLQLGIQERDESWRLWIWVRNLLNADYYTTMATAGAFNSGAVFGLTGEPRTYGISLRGDF
jgi:iron complex outermembrane receptor protein